MSKFDDEYLLLNPEQKKAVDTIEGPLLVVAGPGTGKTQILTLRIANILKKTDASPENILALTFTDNAAENMIKRAVTFIGNDAYRVNIKTFHGFTNEVMMTFPEKFMFTKDLIMIDDLEKYRLVHKILDNYAPTEYFEKFKEHFEDGDYEVALKSIPYLKSFASPYLFQADIVKKIDILKREYISPQKFEEKIIEEFGDFADLTRMNEKLGKMTGKWRDKLKLISKNIELLYFYEIYQKEVQKLGYFDFSDMILFVTEKFQTDEELLAYYQEKYLYILVDEYQDTNGAQNEIVKLLGSFDDSPNIFAVGDDDQSIYRFQGANLENILEFTSSYPRAEVITLVTNYRSEQKILDGAGLLISNNLQRLTNKIDGVDKNIKSFVSEEKSIDEGKIHLSHFSKGDIEYYAICKQIQELNNTGVSFGDMAIIYKKHIIGEKVLDYLLRMNIPVSIKVSSNILNEVIIQQIVKIFEFLIHDNDENFADILNYIFLRFQRLDVFKFMRKYSDYKRANKNSSKNMFELSSDIDFLDTLQISESTRFTDLFNLILKWKQDEKNFAFPQFFDLFLKESGIVEYIKEEKNIDALNSIKSLFDWVKTMHRSNRKYNLTNFLNDIKVCEDAKVKISKEELKTKNVGVNLMTAHASKGLEFEYVFLPKCINTVWGNTKNKDNIRLVDKVSQFDSSKHKNKDDKNEEERRLYFVSLTRAKKQIYISYSDEYIQGGKATSAIESQFIQEIGQEQIIVEDVKDFEDNALDALSTYLLPNTSIDFNEQEKDYLRSLLDNYKLSVTALNNYLKDPQEFLYKNLLKVPSVKTPSLALGTAVHSALENLYRNLDNFSLEKLINVYKQALEKEFLGDNDFELTLKEGTKILSDWYKNKDGQFGEPAELEYDFFSKKCFVDDTQIVGKIDKIEYLDKAKKIVKVVDYKTGSPKSAKQIVGDIADPEKGLYRQLVFYKLLCDLDSRFQYSPTLFELEYIKTKNNQIQKVTLEISNEEVQKLKELITKTMIEIKALNFLV